MQMEAQGYDWFPFGIARSRELTLSRLPTKFDSTQDQDEQSHMASNVAAAIANADTPTAPAAELKPDQAPVTTESGILQAAPSPAPNGVLHEPEPPLDDAVFGDNDTLTNEPAVPASQPMEDLPAPSQQEPTITTSTSSFSESIVPSSILAEVEPSPLPAEPIQPIMEPISEPVAQPQPPTSDLRTSPHTDELTPGEIAMVEEQKHEEDNAAAGSVVASTAAPVEAPALPAPVSGLIAETSKVGASGLATPPLQSPPPTPHPEPAELPEDPPPVPAVEVPEPPVVPLEQPAEPVPTRAEPAPPPEDQIMTDVASPPAKVAREREPDEEETEPTAKRVKTDDEHRTSETAEFKVPEAPATVSSPRQVSGTPPVGAAPPDGDDSVTQPRLQHMKKVISNLKKSNASQAFRLPVDYVALNISTYPTVVKEPMDLGTIDNKLKQNSYTSVSDFTRDFELIVGNCIKFNGKEHAVTQSALKMQSSFNNQMSNLPKAVFAEPSREEKRAQKQKVEPTRQAPPRRPSVSTAPPPPPTGAARSPQASASSATQAFAPGPDGVPLIRRDSNMADGRPKRQIVPTKRNQDYQGGRPKKKKYELQLRYCQEVLKDLTNPKHWQMNQYFTHPVDPVALNIPTYFQLIKKPMDLGTVQTKLDNNVYEKAKDFEEDVRLVFKNCYKFNPEGDHVNQMGHQLEEFFDKRWAGKDDWIASREPASEPQSDEEDGEDDESEDDADDSEVERNDKIANLQKAIAEMSKQMGELTQTKPKKKKSKSPSSQPKKSKSKSSKKDKPRASFPGLQQKSEKKKSVSKPKEERQRFVIFAEKQYISNGIAMLPEKQMQEALRIIQQSVPSLANSDQNEIELDIEEVPNHALLKLLTFVKKYAGPPPDEPKTESDTYSAPAASKSKKSKPQSKQQQEQEIEELQGKLGAYARGPVSPNAVQSIETGDSSDDDGDSEESEEE